MGQIDLPQIHQEKNHQKMFLLDLKVQKSKLNTYITKISYLFYIINNIHTKLCPIVLSSCLLSS
jgi:hypothetical protein